MGSANSALAKCALTEQTLQAIEDCMARSTGEWPDEWRREYIETIRKAIESHRDAVHYAQRLEILSKGFAPCWEGLTKIKDRALFEVYQERMQWYVENLMGSEFPSEDERKLSISSILLSSNRQTDRFAMRSDNCTDRLLFIERLSRKTSADPLCGQRNRTESGVSNQLFYVAGDNYRPALQVPLAGGTVLQMDQAASSYQVIVWHYRECSEDTNMDCNLGLRVGSNNKKATELGIKSLHNSTDFKCNVIRESAYFTSTYGSWLQN